MNVCAAAVPAEKWLEKGWADSGEATTVEPSRDKAPVAELLRLPVADLRRALLGFPSAIEAARSQSAAISEVLASQCAAIMEIAAPQRAAIVEIAAPQSASGPASWVPQIIRWVEGANTIRCPYELLENSTEKLERASEIGATVDGLLASARGQNFEDGMESEFSRELVRVVKTYGGNAIAALADRIMGETVNPEIAAEALRWLGHIDAAIAYRERLYLLECSLSASSAWIRDGASLGLALLDDPQAIPYLKQAIQRERIAELRQDLQLVLSQLENTDQCRCF